jgi:hypothetical protein
VYDDVSADGGFDEALIEAGQDPRFTVRRNKSKLWQVGSLWHCLAQSEIQDEDVIVVVDGDDYLPDPGVLCRIAKAYSDPKVWITYGNFISERGGSLPVPGYCRRVREARSIRKVPWTTSALRTFKAFLFRRIRKEDLLMPGGSFFPAAGDAAAMFPMIEMAGDAHNRCLHSINYVYNRDNPLNNYKVRKQLQLAVDVELRARQPYQPLRPDRRQTRARRKGRRSDPGA